MHQPNHLSLRDESDATRGPSLAFLVCTEPGPLEAESLLLARSIRMFGGRFARLPILSIQPRDTPPLRAETLRAFSAEDVSHLRIRLNTRYLHYPVANKALSAAWAERHLDFDAFVMLDSDKFMLAEPALLDLDAQHPIALRPVHQKLCGSTGADGNADYWSRFYAAFRLRSRWRVETTLHGENILGYWNSGLVAARREAGLYARWLHYLDRILTEPLLPDRARYFADQFALAAAVDSIDHPVRILPRAYNYPIAFHRQALPGQGIQAWSELVTGHYHKMFYQPMLGHPIADTGLPEDERATWLIEALDRAGVYPRDLITTARRTRRWAEREARTVVRRLLAPLRR